MKAGIYDPYLDTLGGGERYCFALAELLYNLGWQVDFFWDGKDVKSQINSRLGFKTEKVSFVIPPRNIFEKLMTHPRYDLLFYVSDGSIPWLFGKRNFLHLQVPFKNHLGRSLLNRLKFLKIDKVICNSRFTKKIVDSEYGVDGLVIYPPVELGKFKPGKKENLLISVGRFSQLLQAKRQDVLISAFKKFFDSGFNDWSLILAGGSEVGGQEYVQKLKKMVGPYPIQILENVSLDHLTKLYSKAKIFWAGSGYEINEEKMPEKVEHFGISVVEAMSAGVIPVLVKKGGFREIIEDGKNGFLWQDSDELVRITDKLAKSKLEKIQKEAIKRSKMFSKEVFNEKFRQIIPRV